MEIVLNGVETDQLAGQMESQHLFTAILIGGIGLDRAAGDDTQTLELIVLAENVIAPVVGTTTLDDPVEPFHILRIETHRQAECGQAAVFTGDLDVFE